MQTPSANPYESPVLRDVTGPAIRPGGLALTRRAVEFCGIGPGAVVLDAGCGMGATVDLLAGPHGLRAAGIDLSIPLLTDGRLADPSRPLAAGRAECLPFRDKSFDAVSANVSCLSWMTLPRPWPNFGGFSRPEAG